MLESPGYDPDFFPEENAEIIDEAAAELARQYFAEFGTPVVH